MKFFFIVGSDGHMPCHAFLIGEDLKWQINGNSKWKMLVACASIFDGHGRILKRCETFDDFPFAGFNQQDVKCHVIGASLAISLQTRKKFFGLPYQVQCKVEDNASKHKTEPALTIKHFTSNRFISFEH